MKININKIFLWGLILIPIFQCITPFAIFFIRGQRIIFVILLLVLFLGAYKKLSEQSRFGTSFLFLIGSSFPFILSTFINDSLPNVGNWLMLLYGAMLITIKDCYKQFVIHKFVMIISVIIALSILEFLLLQATGFGIKIAVVYRNDIQPFQEYILNFVPINHSGYSRFQSITDEPGNIGTFAGFMLFALNNEKYKKQMFIFLIAGLLSMSFAFYVILIIWLFYYCFTSKGKFNYILVIFLLFLLFYFFFGEEISKYIFNRYESDNYDNRSTANFELEFNRFNSGNITNKLLGMGYNSIYENVEFVNSVGLKANLYMFGYLGIGILFLSHIIVFFRLNHFYLNSIAFFIVFWISFYQRANFYDTHNLIIYLSLYCLYLNVPSNKSIEQTNIIKKLNSS